MEKSLVSFIATVDVLPVLESCLWTEDLWIHNKDFQEFIERFEENLPDEYWAAAIVATLMATRWEEGKYPQLPSKDDIEGKVDEAISVVEKGESIPLTTDKGILNVEYSFAS